MQGKLIIGVILATAFGTPAAAAAAPQRQTCQRGEAREQVQQAPQRQQQAQPQQARNRTTGCPVNRAIPSVVDPTPTFLL